MEEERFVLDNLGTILDFEDTVIRFWCYEITYILILLADTMMQLKEHEEYDWRIRSSFWQSI